MKLFSLFKKKQKCDSPWHQFYTDEEINFKLPDETMYEVVKNSSEIYGDYPAFEYFGRKHNYKKLIKKIDTCAKAFNNLGLKKGDIVTICMPNTPEVLYAVYALNKLGVVAHMIHPLSAEVEIKDSINDTNSKYLVMIDLDYEKLESIIDETKLEKVIFVSAANSMPLYLHVGYNLTKKHKYKAYPKFDSRYVSWNKFIRSALFSPEVPKRKLDGKTSAVILHSGGTSGKPKYVVLNNQGFNVSAIQEKIVLKTVVPGDSTLAIMPNFHGFGLSVCMHTPLCIGCYTILVPQFDAKKFDILINQTKPTTILGVPTLYEALINSNNIKNLDLSYLKYIVSGGDQITSVLEGRINKYLKEHKANIKVTQGYGLSEATAAVSLCFDEVNRSCSIGIPLAHNHIKIIDTATRKRVPVGEIGEICINGPTVMQGYLNNERETNDAIQMHDDGYFWLHTGDMGHMDKDGFFYYDQRSKRMIITSGYNVYPSHIEEVIQSHPDVLQCSVVGMPHSYKQEVPKAFIVLRAGIKSSLFKKNEIKNYCKKNLAHYMCPYKYVFRKSLPRTRLGKVDFMSLQEDEGEDDV